MTCLHSPRGICRGCPRHAGTRASLFSSPLVEASISEPLHLSPKEEKEAAQAVTSRRRWLYNLAPIASRLPLDGTTWMDALSPALLSFFF